MAMASFRSSSPAQPAVFLVEDNADSRALLALDLEEAGFNVTAFSSAEACLANLDRLTRGCVVTDVHLGSMDGVDLVRRVRAAGLKLPVIVITGFSEVPLAVEAMRSGATDFIAKSDDTTQLIAAVRQAISEQMEPSVPGEEGTELARRLETLTAREREIFHLLGAGGTSRNIADSLGISPRTVDVFRASIMAKLGARRLAHLVRMAVILGDDAR